MSLKKQYLKTKPICKVTFTLEPEATENCSTVYLVGDFNNWNYTANPMKRAKDGSFSVVLELEPEREYQFRYLIDETRWENDWNADKYVATSFGDSENSVVTV